jgi:hypothetical protein
LAERSPILDHRDSVDRWHRECCQIFPRMHEENPPNPPLFYKGGLPLVRPRSEFVAPKSPPTLCKGGGCKGDRGGFKGFQRPPIARKAHSYGHSRESIAVNLTTSRTPLPKPSSVLS